MVAIAGVTASTVSPPIITLADTINSSDPTQPLKEDSIESGTEETTLESTQTSADTSSEESTPEETTETTTETESSGETADTEEQTNPTQEQESKETTEPAQKEQEKSGKQAIAAVADENTLTIEHTKTDGLTGELGTAIGNGVSTTSVKKVIISGSASLGELDWGKLGQLASVFPNVTSLEIQTADTTIPALTFSGATWLKEINMPNVTTIGSGAFNGVTGATDITLGITDTTQLATVFKD